MVYWLNPVDSIVIAVMASFLLIGLGGYKPWLQFQLFNNKIWHKDLHYPYSGECTGSTVLGLRSHCFIQRLLDLWVQRVTEGPGTASSTDVQECSAGPALSDQEDCFDLI